MTHRHWRTAAAAGLMAALAWSGGPNTARADELASPWTTDKPETRARLVAGVAAGKSIAALEIALAEGWKTYWRFPGDVGGVPPNFDWEKSDNVASVTVRYPAPKRMVDPAGDTLGYKEAVVFPLEVVAKDTTKPVVLRLMLDYGVCKDICVPVQAALAIDMPPTIATPVPANVLAALDHVPRRPEQRRDGDPKLVKAEVKLDDPKPTIAIEAEFPGGTAGADAYVESPSGYYIPLPKFGAAKELGGNRVRFEIDLAGASEPADLKGKTANVTIVSEHGLSETSFKLE